MSGANSTPLGRMNPAIGAGKKAAPTGSSLLKPSYMNSLGSNSSVASATAAAAAAAAAVSAQINHSQNSIKRESESSYDGKRSSASDAKRIDIGYVTCVIGIFHLRQTSYKWLIYTKIRSLLLKYGPNTLIV